MPSTHPPPHPDTERCLGCGAPLMEGQIAHVYDDGALGECCRMTPDEWARERREIAAAQHFGSKEALLHLHRAPCPRCGASTGDDAAGRCQPNALADTGEYTCPGEEMDEQGYILQPTPESIAAEEAMIEAAFARHCAIDGMIDEIDPGCRADQTRFLAAITEADRRLDAAGGGGA